MDFYKILGRIMAEKDLSIPDVARLSGLADSTVRSIIVRENKTVALEVAAKFSKGLNIPLEELNFGIEASKSLQDEKHMLEYKKLNNDGKSVATKFVIEIQPKYPLGLTPDEAEKPQDRTNWEEVQVMEEKAAAGAGNYLNSDDVYDLIKFPTEEIPRRTDFGVRISGQSMEPEIPDGCIVWVECCPQIEDGEIGVFVYDGQSYCKRLNVERKKRRVVLESVNPDFDDVFVTGSDLETLRTVGRVVGYTMEKGI